tara:strand:+ start:8628 stop:8825 length:198 start_codon:yes stop_codon:yes gene_type:complete
MNLNDSNPEAQDLINAVDRELTEPIASEEELRDLAEDIVRYCPSLTHLLLALGSKNKANPLHGMN